MVSVHVVMEVREGLARGSQGGWGRHRVNERAQLEGRQRGRRRAVAGSKGGRAAQRPPNAAGAGRAASAALLLHSHQVLSGQRLSTNQAQSARPQRPRRRRGFLYLHFFLYFISFYNLFSPLTVWRVGVDELLLEGAHRDVGALGDVENLRTQPALRGGAQQWGWGGV